MTAIQNISPRSTRQDVVAIATADAIRTGIARQCVVEAGSNEVLDPGDRIGARSNGVLSRQCGERNLDTRRALDVAEGVDSRPTINCVIAATADDRVLSVTTLHVADNRGTQ